MATCSECGAAVPPDARFCASCGTELTARRPERRRVATILFSDISGSTELGERHDAETVRRVLGLYFERVAAILVRHGGTLEKFIGDAALAVFGVPTAREDDALRAVRAAVEMHDTLASLNDELESLYGVRLSSHTGINTGEVVGGDAAAHLLVTGDAVNVAARLEQAAEPDEILLGEATYALVAAAVDAERLTPIELKGKSAPVAAWRLHAVRSTSPRRSVRVPLVGRRPELAALLAELEQADRDHACRRVTIVGDAGLGKTRLVEELATAGRMLSARCLPYGEGITFWPLAEIVRVAAGVDDRTTRDDALRSVRRLVDDELVTARIAAAIGLADSPAPVEETAWAARHLFEALAEQEPLVLAFDDLHWAEPAFLDLLDRVAATARAPILLLGAARPDLLEARAELPGLLLRLEALADDDSNRLIDLLAEDLPEAVRSRVRTVAAGNPLFVAETVAMLRQRPEEQSIPPTIQALLAARLDALAAPELDVLARAAVVGQELSRAALLELAGETSDLDKHLATLEQLDLLWPATSAYAESTYRFRHILVREAAYSVLLKETRAELHERFARWLARTVGERSNEYEEVVGYHFEQAYRNRVEIAPGDPAAADLAREAAHALGNAGRRAGARGDVHAARDLLERGAALAEDPVVHGELLTYLADARLNGGDVEGSRAAAELARAAATGRSRAVALRADVRLAYLTMMTDPGADHVALCADARAAGTELEELGDLWGATEAAMLQIFVALGTDLDALITAAQTAAALGRRAGHLRVAAEMATWEGVGAANGPMPLDQAVELSDRLFADAAGPLATAHALQAKTFIYALAGRFDAARAAGAESARLFHDLGLEYWVHGVGLARAYLERLADDRTREEQHLRDAVAFLQSVGDTVYLSTYAAELALTLAETGRIEEALALADLSRTSTADGDIESQIGWRLARAQALAARGDVDEAEELARTAVDLERRDSPVNHGQALVVLAEILQRAGKTDDAQAATERALHEFRRKGSQALLDRAHRRLGVIAV